MKYISTRGDGELKTFSEILLEGLAPDGGLYVPEEYPRFDDEMLDYMRNPHAVDYKGVALKVMSRFADDIPPPDLARLIQTVYNQGRFGSDDIVPVVWLEPGLGLLRLSNGPTLSFKDIAMQLLARLMDYRLAELDQRLNILGATSGDTGSAAEFAFMWSKRVNVFMLSPLDRMSPFQAAQMYTMDAPNIHNIAINGVFDQCQDIVKAVNDNADFKARYHIGAINSINWARIAAQVVYYVWGYLRATKSNDERVVFVVPSGNFGNALAAYIARRMGCNIDIVVATNENDVLDEFFRTERGVYRVRKSSEVIQTSSPSMDIAKASNFERLVFDMVGRSPSTMHTLWSELAKTGQFDAMPELAEADLGIRSGKATQEEVIETIREVQNKYDTMIDPHTAVAMKVALEYRKPGDVILVAETARPEKFAATIKEALGVEPPTAEGYEDLKKLPQRYVIFPPEPEAVMGHIVLAVESDGSD